MSTIGELERRREEILSDIRAIRSMRKGSISKQFLSVPIKGQDEPARRGPYYVFSRYQDGKTFSKRLRTPKELNIAQQDIDAYDKFIALCKEFERLTEQLGELERAQDGRVPEKKRRTSRSSETKK